MTIPPENIQVGQCYLTGAQRLRRAVQIQPDGLIRYEHRKAGDPSEAWVPSVMNLNSFALTVERPVPCDWTPETDSEEQEARS